MASVTTVASHEEYSRFATGNFSIQEHVTTGNFVIYIAELIFCFVSFPLNVMFIAVLANTSCIHRNLRMLLISSCASNVVYAVTRYMILTPLLVAYLYNIEISTVGYCWFAKSLHHVVLGASGVTLFVVVIERSLASYLYPTYESQSCYHFGLLLTGFQWTYAIVMTTANQIDVAGTARPYSRLPCQIEYTTGRCISVFIAIGITLNTIAVVMFFKLKKFNRTMFRQRSWKLKSLSETYQIAENVKSIKLLIPVLITMLIGNVISTCLISLNALIYIAVRETAVSDRAVIMTKIVGRGNEIAQSYDIGVIIIKIVFCYAIKTHPALFKRWHVMFCQVKVNPKNDDNHDVTGLDGKKLTFSVIEETQHHFDSLAQLWK